MVLNDRVEVPHPRRGDGAKTGSRWCLRDRIRRCPRNCKRRVAAPFRVTGFPARNLGRPEPPRWPVSQETCLSTR